LALRKFTQTRRTVTRTTKLIFNIDQIEQMTTRPALPAEGYHHGKCSLDVLLNRLSVRDSRLGLPDGMSSGLLGPVEVLTSL
jgi:hypothetical protein